MVTAPAISASPLAPTSCSRAPNADGGSSAPMFPMRERPCLSSAPDRTLSDSLNGLIMYYGL